MTPIPSDLQVLAEMAITLVGFTGVIGVIQHRSGTVLTDRQKLLVSNLVISAVMVILLAFVPTLLMLVPEGESKVWDRSIQIMLIVHIIAWAVIVPFHKRERLVVAGLPLFEQLLAIVFSVLGILAVAVEVALVLGFRQELIPLVYESVLIFLMALGVTSFVVILLNQESTAHEDS